MFNAYYITLPKQMQSSCPTCKFQFIQRVCDIFCSLTQQKASIFDKFRQKPTKNTKLFDKSRHDATQRVSQPWCKAKPCKTLLLVLRIQPPSKQKDFLPAKGQFRHFSTQFDNFYQPSTRTDKVRKNKQNSSNFRKKQQKSVA